MKRLMTLLSRIACRPHLLLVAAVAVACSGNVSAAEPIAVCTYNIRYANTHDGEDVWPRRTEAVIAALAPYDLLGLQEVTKGQLDEVAAGLDDFAWYGVGRDDGRSGGEHAPIFYRQDRFERVDAGTIWLSSTPEEAGSRGWDAQLPRTLTWMVLRDRQADQKLFVANTHFDHRGEQARHESGKLLSKFVADNAGELPVVVMGDFNCMAGSAPYQAITATLQDARSLTQPSGPNSTWNGFREIADGRIIDHVFVGGPLSVESLAVLDPKTDGGRFASDHLPILVKVQLH